MNNCRSLAKTIGLTLLLATTGFALAGEHAFVGVKKCAMCHKKEDQGEQLRIWEESQHSKAYETLKSEAAQKIAKEKGLAKAAHESDECLKCHVAALNAKPELIGDRFAMEDGVQCESCHGAGDDYKSKKVMQDRDASIAAGMNDLSVESGTAKEKCMTCHNDESPTFEGFDFDEYWAKIKHPVPAE